MSISTDAGSTEQEKTTKAADLKDLSPTELIARITTLESQLQSTTAQLAALLTTSRPASPSLTVRTKAQKKKPKPFDPSQYSTRHIALKFSYLGHDYNGFEHSNGSSAPPRPTIEEVLWKALRKSRLISPVLPDDADVDTNYEVIYDERRRGEVYGTGPNGPGGVRLGNDSLNGGKKLRLEISWEGCQYSKCGRTDKGVSAFGQVIGLRVRSNKPLDRKKDTNDTVVDDGSETENDVRQETEPTFDPIRDELPYTSMLNNILPPEIRIHAWCPLPPPDFDARFSCRERQYKYFFTNPAFCPTPGPHGIIHTKGNGNGVREGWLDIEAMQTAAKKLEGLHDFRNFCKLDASKQMTSCQRRITHASVEEFSPRRVGSGMEILLASSGLVGDNEATSISNGTTPGTDERKHMLSDAPRVFTFNVHGTAFLWHQVRCMVAILFLVGQGLEKPEIVDKLLDIERSPGRPQYDMADDAPLVLWDCVFDDVKDGSEVGLKWVYVGDEVSLPAMATKGDGKFGTGGIMTDLWAQWRRAKMQESQTAGLMSMVLSQGDGTSLQRGGSRAAAAEVDVFKAHNQKVFDGGAIPRSVGDYVPVLQRPRMESLEVLNAKYVNGKQARKTARKAAADSGND